MAKSQEGRNGAKAIPGTSRADCNTAGACGTCRIAAACQLEKMHVKLQTSFLLFYWFARTCWRTCCANKNRNYLADKKRRKKIIFSGCEASKANCTDCARVASVRTEGTAEAEASTVFAAGKPRQYVIHTKQMPVPGYFGWELLLVTNHHLRTGVPTRQHLRSSLGKGPIHHEFNLKSRTLNGTFAARRSEEPDETTQSSLHGNPVPTQN